MRRQTGIFTLALVIAVSGCSEEARKSDAISEKVVDGVQPASAFFSTVVPGGIDHERIYLAIPLSSDRSGSREQKQQSREAFFKKAAPGMDKWSQEVPVDLRAEGYGGNIIPDRYVDLKHIEASTTYKIGQSLKMRTSDGVVPIRIAKFEIHFSYASGESFLYAVAEPASGTSLKNAPDHVVASPEMPDCGGLCALARNKPSADKAQNIRAVAIDKLGVLFPSDIPNEERTETLLIYEGHFTRTDRMQYVAFFARHSKDAVDVGKWVTYVVDSDFSLISILGRDSYLQLTPDGIADVNGDGLEEIWCNDLGFEGTAYSLWYLENRTPPLSFGSVEWPYFGL
jgi:hypothetical protein